MAKKRGDPTVSQHMTLLQCLSLLEKIEFSFQVLEDHDAACVPGLFLPDMHALVESVTNLINREKHVTE